LVINDELILELAVNYKNWLSMTKSKNWEAEKKDIKEKMIDEVKNMNIVILEKRSDYDEKLANSERKKVHDFEV
jgi:hypothetical protein